MVRSYNAHVLRILPRSVPRYDDQLNAAVSRGSDSCYNSSPIGRPLASSSHLGKAMHLPFHSPVHPTFAYTTYSGPSGVSSEWENIAHTPICDLLGPRPMHRFAHVPPPSILSYACVAYIYRAALLLEPAILDQLRTAFSLVC